MTIIILLIIEIGSVKFSFGQDSLNTNNLDLIVGKWKVCVNTKFSPDYKCEDACEEHSFDSKGGFIGNNYCYEQNKNYYPCAGKYELNGNHLTCKCDDKRDIMFGRSDYTIIWIDKDRFYHIYNPEGGEEPTSYKYFERIK